LDFSTKQFACRSRPPAERSFGGHHADVIVSNHRRIPFYFVQQGGLDEATGVAKPEHSSVLQVVELEEEDGKLKARPE